jgi:hypothetical protein
MRQMELKFSLELEIRPTRPTGTILYTQEREDGQGDYLALVLLEGVLEFRYNLGGGPVTIRSVQPLTLGHWHRIVAKRWPASTLLVLNWTQKTCATFFLQCNINLN